MFLSLTLFSSLGSLLTTPTLLLTALLFELVLFGLEACFDTLLLFLER